MRFLRRRRRDAEVTDEMRFHIDMEAADLERMGVATAEAQRQALAAFGGVQQHKEATCDVERGAWFGDIVRDIRYVRR